MEAIETIRQKQSTAARERVGATYIEGQGVYIRLWAPQAERVEIEWAGEKPVLLENDPEGYHIGLFAARKPGDRYFFYLDGKQMPDPASRFQPEGVTGPSEVVAAAHEWHDDGWRGIPFEQWVIYELHVGAFSARHDFEGVIEDLPRLKSLGATTLEIMPVAQFPGARNWGYDGVFPHAVQNSYGGPAALKRLVDAAHQAGLAVILDVVYNHLGPEGNNFPACGPYTHDKYQSPWGDAMNFDGPDSDHVRRFFLQGVWDWLTEFHLDGLRLDAVQMIFDGAPMTFLEEVSRLRDLAAKETGRPLVLIAETDMNDPRLVMPYEAGGYGFDGHWADDFHHALHATLTGEKTGYYADYGGTKQLARTYRRGVAFEGEYSPYRRRRHGRSYEGIQPHRLVAEAQNHDQIGNRLLGERLDMLVGGGKVKLAAAAVFLSPFTPLMFMGDEFASSHPFYYFVDHSSEELLGQIREGRKKEWADFGWTQESPDPGAPETFDACVLLDKELPQANTASTMQNYYRDLIALSKKVRRMELAVREESGRIFLEYSGAGEEIAVILSFGVQEPVAQREGWTCCLNSASYPLADDAYAPYSAIVLVRGGQ